MGMGLGLFDTLGGNLLADHAVRAEGVEITTNEHGPERLSYEVALGLADAFAFWDPNGMPWARAHLNGLDLFTGRLEDRRIRDGSLSLQALGPWRALSDLPYTALWSKTSVTDFRTFTADDLPGVAIPDRFNFDTQNHIYIAPQKNSTQGTTAGDAMMGFLIPDSSTRDIIGVSFDFTFVTTAANWRAAFQTRNADFSGIANPWLITSAGAGTTVGSINVTFAAAKIVNFFVDFNAAAAVYGGETGDIYLKITNLRLVTSTTNRISTTLGTAIAAGTRTVTPGSMARIYVGQRLHIAQGSATVAESVVVTAITTTTFTAAFAFAHVAADTVTAHVVYADEIARDMATTVNATNATQLSSSAALISSPGLDLTDISYEDANMADALIDLAAKGDTAGQRWEVGATVVGNSPLLFFRAEGSASQTWYVDALDIDVERSLEILGNSVYAKYTDANNRTLRTAASTNTSSVNRYGLTRRQAISADTTNATLAQTIRSTALADTGDPPPRAGVTFTRVFDAYGSQHLLAEIVANDTIVIRNLPPSLATTVDQIRSFRIKHTSYKADDDSIEVEPDVPRPALEFFLSRLAIGIGA